MGSDSPDDRGQQEDSREARLQVLWHTLGQLDETGTGEFQGLVKALLEEGGEDFAREYSVLCGKDCDRGALIDGFLPKLVGIRRRLADPLTRGRLLLLYRGHLWDLWLDGLWKRRSSLSEREWGDFLYLTRLVLKLRYRDFSKYYSALCRGDVTPQELIDDFFLEKIVLPALNTSGMSGYLHAGSLAVFYERFLIGLMRRLRQVPDQDSRGGDVQNGQYNEDDESAQGWIGAAESPEGALAEHGLTEERVRASALYFLRQSEAWVTLFLGRSVCADKGSSIPMYKLAARHGIRSQADKARKLGISLARPRKGKAAGPDAAPLPLVRDSLLVKWIESLGVKCIPENREAILVMLNILCVEALIESKELER